MAPLLECWPQALNTPPMPRWKCAACDREFGRSNQSHMCVPAISVDGYFAARPARDREIFDSVLATLDEIGDVHIEAVSVGVLIKRSRTFAELRPRRDGLGLSVLLSRALVHPRVTRTTRASGERRAYTIPLRGPADVDDLVRAWLAESWSDSPL